MAVDAFPLSWPNGWPRTLPSDREEGRYRYMKGSGYSSRKPLTMYQAQQGLYEELERLGVDSVVVSSNLKRNLDGSIRSNQSRPEDPGIAIYFKWNGKDMVMAMDDFIEPECNVRRLALAIKAMRDLERNGGGVMMERAFTGFAALPAPIHGNTDWRSILNFRVDEYPSKDEINARFKKMAMQHHSDIGGSDDNMAALNAARESALADIPNQ